MSTEKDLRTKVLNASLVLIAEGGLDRLSMREVARKAGVSHQAPYHYFGDREAILAAIAGEGFVKLKQELERAAASTGNDATKAVEAMGRAYVDFALRHPAYFQVMFRADAVPLENYPEAQRQEDAAFGLLVQMIDGAFGAQPAEARQKIAILCWALAHGLATLLLEGSLARKVGVSKARQKQVAAEVIQTFSKILERGSA